jgi:hypothetical protein
MTIARDDYREYFHEKLWEWMPAIYREFDAQDGGGALRAFLSAVAAQAARIKRNQDRLWDDSCVELASDWAVPYIGDLVATRLVAALNLRARRVDVAKTIYYRRRKGTLAVLEQLISDMTGWDGKVVEEFRRLGRMHHGLDGIVRAGRLTQTPEGGLADLRSVRGAALVDDAFCELHFTPDMRRPHGLVGRRGIPKLTFHVLRLHPVELRGVDPRRVVDHPGSRDGFTFDPSGRDVPLFATDQSHPSGARMPDAQGDWSQWRTAAEWQLPRRILCRLLGEAIFEVRDAAIAWILTGAPIALPAQRQAAAADLRKLARQRFLGRTPFLRLLQALPSSSVLTQAGVLAGLLPRTLVADCGSAALLANGTDPASWPGPIVAQESSIGSPAVAVSFDGVGPVPRSRTRAAKLETFAPPVVTGVDLFVEPERGRFVLNHAPHGASAVRVSYHTGMLVPIGAGAFGRQLDSTAPAALWAAGAFGAGTPANGLAQVEDSRTYVGPPDQLAVASCIVRAREAQRPYVLLSNADWRFIAAAANALLELDGLWVGARQAGEIVLGGNFERVRLRTTTLDPGGTDAVGAALPAVSLVVAGFVERLVVQQCILASIRLQGPNASIERLVVRDSILHARTTGVVAIDAPGADVQMARTTVIAPQMHALALRIERLYATDSLIAGRAQVVNTQEGCFRFSARAPGSRVPHPYRSYIVDDMPRLFASLRFGDPSYAQLSAAAPPALQRAAESGSEIGAFCSALVPIKHDSLKHKIDEYMPFGRLPNILFEN